MYCLQTLRSLNVVATAPYCNVLGTPTQANSNSKHIVYDILPSRGKVPESDARSQIQALVYDILPSTTAVFSYAIGFRKLSANEQFFVGAQTVVSLLRTTQIKQIVSFIAANKVYTSTNKTTIV